MYLERLIIHATAGRLGAVRAGISGTNLIPGHNDRGSLVTGGVALRVYFSSSEVVLVDPQKLQHSSSGKRFY
jgi:hypothetical protein